MKILITQFWVFEDFLKISYYTVKAIGTINLILFSTYAFAYDASIENSLQSDRILFSYQAIATKTNHCFLS